MRNILVAITIGLMISGCAVKDSPAPIVYNHKNSNLVSTISGKDTSEGEIISGPLDLEQENISLNKKEEFIEPHKIANAEENLASHVKEEPHNIPANKKIVEHEVQADEMIEDVAALYGVTVGDVAKLNKLSPPYAISEFQILKIAVDDDTETTAKIHATTDDNMIAPAPKPAGMPKEVVAGAASATFKKPVDGKLIAKFGQNTANGSNKGINIAAPAGTKVVASASGKVVYADFDAIFGNLVIIKLDGKSTVTAYAHLEDLMVQKGAHLNQGDLVGYVGASGKVKESQLHFAIREGKKAVDPLKYVKY